jgi:hypothetical protein
MAVAGGATYEVAATCGSRANQLDLHDGNCHDHDTYEETKVIADEGGPAPSFLHRHYVAFWE